MIDPLLLQQATVQFLMQNMDSIKNALQINPAGYKQYCIDGKEENGSGRKYNTDEKIANLQTLHVYDASDGICLCSSMIDSKTNEIPVAQELLKMFQLKGAIVTFDSMHTQQKTINIIADAKGDYVGGLKGNQPTLEALAKERFSDAAKEKIKTEAVNYYETLEKAHNQVEKRCYYLTKARQKIDGLEEFKKLRSFVCCETNTEHLVTGKQTKELRYYMASLTDVKLCAEAIRGHWSAEVQLHWHLDYSFGQDDNTTMDKNAFSNFSQMNKMALSLYKLFQSIENKSIRRIRKKFGWSLEDNLTKMLTAFDEETLKNALENAQNKKK